MNSRSGGQRHATQPGGPSSAAHPAAADAVDADRSHGLPAQALRVTARVTVTVMSPPAPGDQAADVARDPVAALAEFIALPDTVLSWDRNAEDNGDAQGPDVGCPGCGPGDRRQAHHGGEPGCSLSGSRRRWHSRIPDGCCLGRRCLRSASACARRTSMRPSATSSVAISSAGGSAGAHRPTTWCR